MLVARRDGAVLSAGKPALGRSNERTKGYRIGRRPVGAFCAISIPLVGDLDRGPICRRPRPGLRSMFCESSTCGRRPV
jgi:hypothetical protein